MPLSEEQIERFSRHILLREVGGKGQEKLLGSSALVIGAGGLGSPVALYLAAAGVGRIGLIDFDTVSLANLQRQILYRTKDVGRPKVEAAAERLSALWPEAKIEIRRERFSEGNARRLVRQYGVVIDGSDNFDTKFLANDACVAEKIPLVMGGILRFDGQILTVIPGKSACYRCLFERPPPPQACPSCAEAGVVGALAGVLGALQATEAIKLLLGIGEPLASRLLTADTLRGSFREVPIGRRAGCEACGERARISLPG